MKKTYLILIILTLVIGFATVTTNLVVSGKLNIGFNEDEFNVYFSYASIDGTQNNNLISSDKQTIIFNATENNILEFDITNESSQYDAIVSVNCTPKTNENYTIESDVKNKKILAKDLLTGKVDIQTQDSSESLEITCTLEVVAVSRTEKNTEEVKKRCEYELGTEWEFNYTGSSQEFKAPCDATYKVELWGAQGGNSNTGGKGAYTSGEILLNKESIFYINIGGSGFSHNGYNGGGKPLFTGYAGGGASDVRVKNDNLYSRIMVAAGGSGSSFYQNVVYNNGVAGGGLVGNPGLYLTYNCTGRQYPVKNPAGGGTQISPGAAMQCNGTCMHGNARSASFGIGADDSIPTSGVYGSSGGGGGWYGGGGGTTTNCDITSSASGSSYISGHIGCIGSKSDSTHVYDSSCTTNPTLVCSTSYTGYIFTKTEMIDGNGYSWTNVKNNQTNMPTHDGSTTMIGNSGDGYGKITLVSLN